MKYICTISILLVFTILSASAAKRVQSDTAIHEEKIETIFGSDGFTNGGFGAFEMKPGSINGKAGLFLGGRGGWIINHVVSIGGGGYGLVTKPEIGRFTANGADTTLSLNFGYGGLIFEYTNNSFKALHFTVNTLIGAGSASYKQINSLDADMENDNEWDNKLGSSTFFVVEPSITAEINVLSYFRVAIGASYRFVSGVDLAHYVGNSAVVKTSAKDLSGFNGVISFKFGKF